MALSILDDKSLTPDRSVLKEALGKSMGLFESIAAHLEQATGVVADEWAFSGAKYGWSLRLLHKKRRIIYCIPQDGWLLAAFVLSDKAVEAALEGNLRADVKEIIRNAPKYAEGTGFRLQVKSGKDVPTIKKLIDIKLAS